MQIHIVQKGDTIWKIAKQYGISFDELKRLNAHLANPDYIVPGMEIFLPPMQTPKMKPDFMESPQQPLPNPVPQELPQWQGEMPQWQGEMPQWQGEMPQWQGGMPQWQGEMPQWQGSMPMQPIQPMPMPFPQMQAMPQWQGMMPPAFCCPPMMQPYMPMQQWQSNPCGCGREELGESTMQHQDWRSQQVNAYYDEVRTMEQSTNPCFRHMQVMPQQMHMMPWQC